MYHLKPFHHTSPTTQMQVNISIQQQNNHQLNNHMQKINTPIFQKQNIFQKGKSIYQSIPQL